MNISGARQTRSARAKVSAKSTRKRAFVIKTTQNNEIRQILQKNGRTSRFEASFELREALFASFVTLILATFGSRAGAHGRF